MDCAELFTRENKIEKARGSFWKNLVSDKAALYRLLVVSFFAVLAQIMLLAGHTALRKTQGFSAQTSSLWDF